MQSHLQETSFYPWNLSADTMWLRTLGEQRMERGKRGATGREWEGQNDPRGSDHTVKA